MRNKNFILHKIISKLTRFDHSPLININILYNMEVYEIVAICIGIGMTSFTLIAITSIFYCMYIRCRGCANPPPTSGWDGTVITDKSACHSTQFSKAITEKVNQNIGISLAPTYVWGDKKSYQRIMFAIVFSIFVFAISYIWTDWVMYIHFLSPTLLIMIFYFKKSYWFLVLSTSSNKSNSNSKYE